MAFQAVATFGSPQSAVDLKDQIDFLRSPGRQEDETSVKGERGGFIEIPFSELPLKESKPSYEIT